MAADRKKTVIPLLLGLLFAAGLCAFAFFGFRASDPGAAERSAALEPSEGQIIGESRLTVGDTDLTLLIKSSPEGFWYEFYSGQGELRLLAKVMSFVQFEPPKEEGGAPYVLERDITGDGVPEILVLAETNGKGLREYEILRLEDGQLSNIVMRGRTDNPMWVDAADIEYRDGHVMTSWGGAVNETGRSFYVLEDDELVLQKSVMLAERIGGDSGTDGADTGSGQGNTGPVCDVSVLDATDGPQAEFSFVERLPCDGEFYYDMYYYLSAEQLAFLRNLSALASDAKWRDLAAVYRQTCEIGGLGATFGGDRVLSLPDLVARASQGIDFAGGSRVLSVPCGQGAYQSWYLAVLEEPDAYVPLMLEKIREDGSRYEEYSAIEGGYDPATGIYSYTAAGNGMHTCWEQGDYRLVGKQLVLQKFTADWTCEEGMDGQVIYEAAR